MKKNKEVKDQEAPGRTRIHNARFYNLSPRAINCMDYNKIDHKLALARNDGSIEIWDIEHTLYFEKTSTKTEADFTVDCIAWAGKRLFSASLNGEIVEWDTETLTLRRRQRVTGNAIWCLAVNKQCSELAIGTEEGYINIFNIENDEFQYKLLFDKQEGRVLCCSFDVTGNHLVTGSVNALRIWNAQTGHALQKMTLPKGVDNKDTIIWTLQVLEDFSIIVGDSRGYITVYDGHTADHLEAHQVLKADILAIHVNETRDMLVCSGVEPIIRLYAKTKIKREDTTFYRWVKYLQRAVHDHDVKALLCVSGDRILSGGVDGYLGVSFITRMRSTISRHGPFLRHPFAIVADVANLMLLRYPEYLEIWSLGTPSTPAPNGYGGNDSKHGCVTYALESPPKKIVQLRSKNDEPIVSSAISPNGRLLCYSTVEEVRLFSLSNFQNNEKEECVPALTRIKMKSFENLSISHICFSNDSQRLYLLSRSTKQLLIFENVAQDQELCELTLVDTIYVSKHITGCTTHLALSGGTDRYIAIADDQHTIGVWVFGKSKKYEHKLNLPRYEAAATTAIAIHANIPRVVAAFSDSRLAEYDLDTARYTCWSDQAYVVPNTESHCITQIILDERNPDIIILQNDAFLFTLEKYAPQDADDLEKMSLESKAKKPKTTISSTKNRQMLSLRLKFKKTYEHLVHTSWLSKNDLVTVSVNPNLLMEQLPPAFKQKKYGTS